ncbi:MAG TPA: hypothetical protein VFK89_00720 [Actinomycetota bacterium]|nr:hypothetical protein [Actinomycetota bacterium]
MWRLLLFMFMVNGPLAGVLILDAQNGFVAERRARRALAAGRCQRRVPSLPGGVCGQPIVARIDVWQGYEYRFHEWVCDEHTRDARLRARGFNYRVEDAASVGG